MKTLARYLSIASLLVAAAALACTKIPMSWFGSGGFNSPQKMGDVRLFLDGATAPALWVHESNYDAQCRTTAYIFNGTTSDGFNFSGYAVPGKSHRRQPSIITFTMTVTSIQVTDPVTGQVLATDDGGFKIDFASH
jgi:hypothetical protein